MLIDRRFRLFILLIILAGQVLAQSNSDSPYSRFGLGIMSQPGFTKNRAMGGAGLGFRDANHINFLNPASYSAMDTMSFLFDFGVMGHHTYTEYTGGNDSYTGMNMDHLAFSFPIKKWGGVSIGVLPYTKVGYSIKEEDFQENVGFLDYYYTGNGGVNQFYIGTSILLFDRLSIGANFKYLFGSIDLKRSVTFPFEASHSVTVVESNTLINDFIIDLGLQYSQDFAEKYNVTVGLLFDNKTKISAENRISKSNLFPGEGATIDSATYLDPEFILEESSSTGNIVIPRNFGAGISFRYNNKLTIGLDYYEQDWSKASFFYSNQTLSKSNSFHGGFEIIPDPAALRGYHKLIAYRLGGHYKNSYLKIENEQLKDYGISFGVGLPLRGLKSSFNLAIEGGRMGSLENELIRENYLYLSFSITLHDFWFMKRKFD